MKLEIKLDETKPNEVNVYEFITKFSMASGFSPSDIVISAITHYAWFVRMLNAGRKFYVEENINGKRKLAPVVFTGDKNNEQ